MPAAGAGGGEDPHAGGEPAQEQRSGAEAREVAQGLLDAAVGGERHLAVDREDSQSRQPSGQIRHVIPQDGAERGHDREPDQVAVGLEKGRGQDQDDPARKRDAGGLDERGAEHDAEGMSREEVERGREHVASWRGPGTSIASCRQRSSRSRVRIPMGE